MALASQSSRSQSVGRSSISAYRNRRQQRQRRVLGIFLLALLGLGLGYWLWQQRAGGPRSAAAETGNPNVHVPANPLTGGNTDAASKPSPAAPPPAVASTPPTPPPVVVDMSLSREPVTPAPAPSTGNSLLPDAAMDRTKAPATPLPPPEQARPHDGAVRDPLANPSATRPHAPGAAQPSAPIGAAPATLPPDLQAAVSSAETAIAQGKLVDARATLGRVLADQRTSASDREAVRRWMAEVNETLVFSPVLAPGDTIATSYKVVKGDSLPVIMRKLELSPDFLFLGRINKMSDPSKLQVGQTLKTIRGPFHAVVVKSAFRMDLYAGPTPTTLGTSTLPDGAEPGWTYIRSVNVGLGTADSTPVGSFTVKSGSKVVNPGWRNPRTGERFDPNNPKNPIGERWMGLEGLDESSRKNTDYGIHGTVEPESIGRQMSMGCVRLGDRDVELVFEMLGEKQSIVKIIP